MSTIVSQRMDSVFLSLCKGLNTPKSLAAWLLYSHREFVQLLQLAPRAEDYLDADSFRDDYLISEYLSKCEALPTGINTRAAAYESFVEAENACARTNRRLRSMFDERSKTPGLILRVFTRAQTIIESVLGAQVPAKDVLLAAGWSGGSTASLKGEEVSYQNKLREERISCTHDALPLLRGAMSTDYEWLRCRGIAAEGPTSPLLSEFQIVSGSRGLFVPKNAKTDRFISAEPSGNLFLQLGFGDAIRRRLKRVGINLDDQTINQGYARQAEDLGLATVDLSKASDTICRELVWLLLPNSWAMALDAIRSPVCFLDGKLFVLSKFSSMGNGFTFELETLIFWALTRACQMERESYRGPVSVYGDDIICPTSVVETLSEIFAFAGFTVNEKKTHYKGRFRESCGKHYYGGYDVTPIYQKTDMQGLERIRAHNRLLYHAIDRGFTLRGVCYADRRLRRSVQKCRDESSRIFTPLIDDVKLRSLDGGYATGSPRSQATLPGAMKSYNVLTFITETTPMAEDVGFALHLRKCDKDTFRFYSSHFSLAYRLQKLRTFAEPLPYQGTENKRYAGRWRRTRRTLPIACKLQWV